MGVGGRQHLGARVVLQAAASDGWLGKFMCDEEDGYNCMGRYDIHGGLTVSLLACPGELAELYGEVSGMKSLHTSTTLPVQGLVIRSKKTETIY